MGSAFVDLDIASVRRCAPRPLPRALHGFLDWLAETGGGESAQPFASLRGGWMDDFWIDYGSDLSEFFTIFVVMGEGSRIAVWHAAIDDVDEAPVVLVGSEGDLEFLGSTTLHFLARLAV